MQSNFKIGLRKKAHRISKFSPYIEQHTLPQDFSPVAHTEVLAMFLAEALVAQYSEYWSRFAGFQILFPAKDATHVFCGAGLN